MEEIRRIRAQRYAGASANQTAPGSDGAAIVGGVKPALHSMSQLTAHLDQHYYLKNQEKPRTVNVSIDPDSARIFATPALANSLMRFGVMYGRVYPAEPLDDIAEAGALPAKQTFRVLVDTIYEPPQGSTPDAVTIGVIGDPYRDSVDTLATALGLRVVGFAITHATTTLADGSRGPPDYVLSGPETILLTHYQALYGAHCVAVVISISDDATSAFSAYQASDQACLLYCDGCLAPATGIVGAAETPQAAPTQLRIDTGALPTAVAAVAAAERGAIDATRHQTATEAAAKAAATAFCGRGMQMHRAKGDASPHLSGTPPSTPGLGGGGAAAAAGASASSGSAFGRGPATVTDDDVAAVLAVDGEDIRGLVVCGRDLVHTTTGGKRERVRRVPSVRFLLATAISPLDASEGIIRSRFVRLNRFEAVTLTEAANYLRGRPPREPFAAALGDFHFLAFLASEGIIGRDEAALVASALAVAGGWAVERATSVLSVAPPTLARSLASGGGTYVHTATVFAGWAVPPTVQGVPRATPDGATVDAQEVASAIVDGLELVVKGCCGIDA